MEHAVISGEEITLRPAQKSDCEILLEWRNDPETRKYSFSSHKISAEEHSRWFDGVLVSKKRVLMMIMVGEERVGQVRFDIMDDDSEAEINVTIAPAWRGKGLGSIALRKACERFFNERESLRCLRARIKKFNKASINAFHDASFKEAGSDSQIVLMVLRRHEI
ncbi:MAG: GNAT family N-acetyltransferase [Candidatus Altiarchaeota archaeon]|nr:GNAT family N-acetyltransferase [Candidatus Altiarchaeota archaeon]